MGPLMSRFEDNNSDLPVWIPDERLVHGLSQSRVGHRHVLPGGDPQLGKPPPQPGHTVLARDGQRDVRHDEVVVVVDGRRPFDQVEVDVAKGQPGAVSKVKSIMDRSLGCLFLLTLSPVKVRPEHLLHSHDVRVEMERAPDIPDHDGHVIYLGPHLGHPSVDRRVVVVVGAGGGGLKQLMWVFSTGTKIPTRLY